MSNQVPWNKFILETFISEALLTKDEEMVMRTRVAGWKYCIVIAQAIPAGTTISSPVYITIGTGLAGYPLMDKCCRQVTACGVRTRTKYSTRVVTTSTGGSFRLLGDPCCQPNNKRRAIDGTDA